MYYRSIPIGLAAFFLSISALFASERPNIVLVMADDQGWGDVGYQDHPKIQTPNLDQAAFESVRLDRFYAAAPVCSPTRCSVLTGRHPNRSAVFSWGWPIRPQEITLAEILQDTGYSTGHFGKWHLGSVRRDSPVHPGHCGFERWISAPNFYDNDPILCDQGRAVQYTGESSIVTANLAIDWIRAQAQGSRPVFAVVWFGSPHSPHRAAREDRNHYPKDPVPRQNYYGEVTGLDRAFGAIRDALRDLGIRDNTILWYCSDNGADQRMGSAGPFRAKKGSIYEGGLLVPGILEWPARFPEPKVTMLRATTCDILPTVLAAAGIDLATHRPLDGVNLLPLLEENKASRPQALSFWKHATQGQRTPSAERMQKLLNRQAEGGDLPADTASAHAGQMPQTAYPTDRFPGHSARIEGDWKLHRIEGPQGKIRYELYHLGNDPYEKNNVIEQYPKVAKQLKKAHQTWQISIVKSLNGEDY